MKEDVDELDRKILNLIQVDFPVSPRPYQELGERLGISEREVIRRVKALRFSGIIRRIGGSFDSRALGFCSTLCAAKVPPETVEDFNRVINAYPGVTHNYMRSHAYNVWFTFIGETREEIDRALDTVTLETGIQDILSLPARRTFKIKVNFEI
jgi:DNA-binding Lrp family transcriptional regulator